MAAKGETVLPVIATGIFWCDADNVDAPKIAAVLYD